MKISCIREKLHNAVAQVEKVTGKNLTLPILGAILLEARAGKLTLRATNLNVGVEVTIPAKVESEGVVAVEGGILNNILNQIKKDKNIDLEAVEGNISITTPSSSMVVKSYPTDDFPTLPKVETSDEFTISIQKFIESIKAVSYSAAVSDIKPEIASVYMYPNEGNLVFVATDSFRLAEKALKTKNLPDFSGVLIPIRNINDIVKVFGGEKGDMKCVIGENQIAFMSENVYMTSRLINGVFPDYRQIIPTEFSTEVTTLTSDLLQSLRVVDIFSDKFNQVDITMSPKDKKCVLASKNEDVGKNETVLDTAINGESMQTSINQKYLMDVFTSITTDSVALHFSEANKPLVVRGVGDATFTYLIMPMNR
jgi:DNA polymerase-3 subunit beta